MLTVLIPTRNRPLHCLALLTMFEHCGLRWPVVFADSSNAENAERLSVGCGDRAEILHYPEHFHFESKTLAAVSDVSTPYLAFLPDDDVALPHALKSCHEFLQKHSDFVAAHGYVLDFRIAQNVFDMTRVRWFTPDISEDEPLQRLYHLLRRYQPFFWSVYRTEALQEALTASNIAPQLTVFRELTTMATMVLRGKIARLPCVFLLRGMEQSQSSISQTNPFHAMLEDAPGFFALYDTYRNLLLDHIERAQANGKGEHPSRAYLKHLVDLMHVILFAPLIDSGMLNAAVQRLLGNDPAMHAKSQWGGQARTDWDDKATRPAKRISRAGRRGVPITNGTRRYVWRRAVLKAEPREEIKVSKGERQLVESQLDHYDLN